MNKRIIVCFWLLLSAPAGFLFAQQGPWGAGIEGGPGLSLIYGSQSIYSHSRFSLAGAAGIFGEYGFARNFSAKLALHYERVSTQTDNYSAILPPGGMLQYNLDYLSLPVLVKWSFGGRIRFFVNAGPCLSLLLQESLWHLPENGSKVKVAMETDAYLPVNLAVTAGCGVAIPVGKRLLVTLELRDNFGVINIRSSVSDFEKNSYFSGAEIKGYTNSTLLMAGVCYRFGGSKGLSCSPNDPDFQYIRK
ncbi:MAG: porin family protein [Bacteroidetes bacterium]|nr:porin family protein [Bacteroidota bacterium]